MGAEQLPRALVGCWLLHTEDNAVPQIRCDVEAEPAEKHRAAGSSCYSRGWFWAAALPAILILGVSAGCRGGGDVGECLARHPLNTRRLTIRPADTHTHTPCC